MNWNFQFEIDSSKLKFGFGQRWKPICLSFKQISIYWRSSVVIDVRQFAPAKAEQSKRRTPGLSRSWSGEF